MERNEELRYLLILTRY